MAKSGARVRRRAAERDADSNSPRSGSTTKSKKRPAASSDAAAKKKSQQTDAQPPRAEIKPQKILVLDPGFRSLTGHHFNNNLSLLQAGADLGMEFRLLAGDSCAPVGVVDSITTPHFATDLYEGSVQYQESWEFDCWLHVNTKFRKDLKAIPDADLDWATLILVPAITQFHALALAEWLSAQLKARPKLKAVIQLMFSPTWTAWDAVCSSGDRMYKEAFDRLSEYEGDRVFYCSELEASCKEFEPLLSSKVAVLPHPGIWREPTRPKRARPGSSSVRIGYFGYAKREKGFHLVPEVIRLVREEVPVADASFFVQVNHGAYDPEIVAADEALKTQRDAGTELSIGSMSNKDYLDAFEAADILLLPYDPELYRGRGSGVFSEAIGYGKVVIAPETAGVGEEIKAGNGAGVLFAKHDPRSVADAVIAAVEDAEALTQIARRSADKWRRTHSGAGYLTILGELVS